MGSGTIGRPSLYMARDSLNQRPGRSSGRMRIDEWHSFGKRELRRQVDNSLAARPTVCCSPKTVDGRLLGASWGQCSMWPAE
jgi:hypothetical protein